MKASVAKDLDEAERAIGRILRDLEAKHPSYCVTELGLNTIETTNLESTRHEFSRRVSIELAANAQNDWVV
jgi:hypothetical protein